MDEFYQRARNSLNSNNIIYNLLKEDIKTYLRETSQTNLSELRKELIIEKAKNLSQIEYQQLISTINKASHNTSRRDDKEQLIDLSNSLLQNTTNSNENHSHNYERHNKRKRFSSSIEIIDTNWKYKLVAYNERMIGDNIHIYDLVFKDSTVSLQVKKFKMSFLSRNIRKSLRVEYNGGNKLYYSYEGRRYKEIIERGNNNISIKRNHVELNISIPESKILLTVKIPTKKRGYRH